MYFFTRRKVILNIYGTTISITLLQGDRTLAAQTFACQPFELDGGRIKCPSALIEKINNFLSIHKCTRINAVINAPFFATAPARSINFYLLQLLLTLGKTPLIVKRIVAIDVPTLTAMTPQEQQERTILSTDYLQPLLGGTKSANSWLALTTMTACAACLAAGIATIQFKPIITPSPPPTLAPKNTNKNQFKRDQQLLQLLSEHTPNEIIIEQYLHPAPEPAISRKKIASSAAAKTIKIQGLALDCTSIVTFCQNLQRSAPFRKFNLSKINMLARDELATHQNALTGHRYRFSIEVS